MPRSTKQKTKFTPKSVPRSVSPPAPRSVPVPRSVPAPALTPTPLPVQTQSQSMYSTIKQGFGLGLGSAIAHRLFDPSPHRNENIPKNEVIPKNDVILNNESKLTTEKMYELYNKCLEKNDNKIDCNIILQQNTC